MHRKGIILIVSACFLFSTRNTTNSTFHDQTRESLNFLSDGGKSGSFSRAFSTLGFNLKFTRLNRDLIINAREYISLLVEGFPVAFLSSGVTYENSLFTYFGFAWGTFAFSASTLLLKSIITGLGCPSLLFNHNIVTL